MKLSNVTAHLKLLSIATAFIIACSVLANPEFCRCQAMENADQQRTWQVGLFFAGGAPPSYMVANSHIPVSANIQLQMYSFGFEGGKLIGRAHGKGILRGLMEMRAEAIPFWIGRYPAQTVVIRYGDGSKASEVWNGKNFSGSSITPLMARWNFNPKISARYSPWIQMGAGALWTNHKFPITIWASPSSAFNFTPQIGAGFNVFQYSKRSIEFGIKAVHISNAGLGDSNPGVNQTIMGSIGYCWWR